MLMYFEFPTKIFKTNFSVGVTWHDNKHDCCKYQIYNTWLRNEHLLWSLGEMEDLDISNWFKMAQIIWSRERPVEFLLDVP